MNSDFLQKKVLPKTMKFVNAKPMKSIVNSMMSLLPLTLIGSIFLIIAYFPIKAWKVYIASIGVQAYLSKAFNASTGIMAIACAFLIAYNYAKESDVNPIPCALTSLMCFFIICPDKVTKNEITVGSVFDMTWAGTQGLVGAIIVGVFVGWIYCLMIKKNIKIKMPKEVPAMVSDSFSALIPAAVAAITALVVYIICDLNGTTLLNFIYKSIQQPLQGLTGNWVAVIASALVSSIFWWLGVHGGSVNQAVFDTFLIANLTANLAITEAGLVPSAETGGYIFTAAFNQCILTLGGSGCTLGMVLYMLFFAKSKTYKSLGKISIVPSLFNVNEPVIFGTPIVLNPLLFIPFVATPLISGILGYVLISVGILPYSIGYSTPGQMPILIKGFIGGGWQWMVFQAFLIVLSFVIYYPFIKKADEIKLEEEKGNAEEISAS